MPLSAYDSTIFQRWYNRAVERFVFVILVGLLTVSASGVSSFFVDEPCTGFELATQGEDEGTCPPTCLTCGCCAQAIEPLTMPVAASPDAPASGLNAVLRHLPKTEPNDILHVPKLLPS